MWIKADVVRHPVVAAIVNAYDAFDKEQARIKQEKIKALSLEASNGD